MNSAVHAVRRTASLAAASRLKVHAALAGLHLAVSVHPAARLGHGVLFEPQGRGAAGIVLDRGAVVESGALLRIAAGARLIIGPGALVRRHAVLNVAGRLELRGDNLLSWGSVIHCAERVILAELSGTGEGVSIVDGAHFRLGDDDHWYHRSATAPVHIGRNVWLASKCLVGRGVTIGASSTVAAGSIVTSNVPARSLVAGAPARVIRRDINAIQDLP